MGTNTTKPYKIQEANGVGRVGITAVDLQDLKKKALERLSNISADFEPYEDDGTAVLTQDYFKRLPAQTCFTFLASGEGDALKMDFLELQLRTLKFSKKHAQLQNNITDQVKQFLSGENAEVVNRALLDYLTALQSNIDPETREDDPAWFDGLHERYRTKEAVMKDGAKTRIRNYYQKTREYVLEQYCGKAAFLILEDFRQELRLNDYNGQYFVRSAEEDVRICDDLGWFKCEGKFNKKDCEESHSINPYGSKEARIVFSTWNLDHVIEKSRDVLPTFVEASANCPKGSKVNWQYFYDLLFTKKNLKLVHIACHIKGVHTGKKCDKKQFYKATGGKRIQPAKTQRGQRRSKRLRK